MTLEKKAQRFIEQLGPAGVIELWKMTPAEARAASRGIKRDVDLPRLARTEAFTIDRPEHPPLPLLYFEPLDEPRALLLYFHGGGWTLGSAAESDNFVRILSAKTGCAVVSVDYRLAPEWKFPAAIIDGMDAAAWCASALPGLTGLTCPLYCMGDSAGANIATVVARAIALDPGRYGLDLAGQILTCPVTDHRMDSGSYREFADGPLISRRLMEWFWDNYLPDRTLRADPRASPLLAANLSVMPPTFILTAENDVLRDEGEGYAEALARVGVDVTVKRYAGQIHGFVSLVGLFDGGAEALNDIADFLSGAMARDRR
jgi:acetyl esterase